MKTETRIVIERENSTGDLLAIYSNNPNAEVVIVGPSEMEECGCCGAHHRSEFDGDCREDRERFARLN
jgi:hypothetical protein